MQEYLTPRPLTAASLKSMAQALYGIVHDLESCPLPVFFNILRGSLIPTVVVSACLGRPYHVLTVPASMDEVSLEAVKGIFSLFISKEHIAGQEVVWIDEAYSGHMGFHFAALLAEQATRLGAAGLRIYFIADDQGRHIRTRYRTGLEKLAQQYGEFLSIQHLPVLSLHWMDNIDLLGVNWGRTYEGLGDPMAQLADHGCCTIPVSKDKQAYRDYRLRYRKAQTLHPADRLLPLEKYARDPHTLWCLRSEQYKDKYRLVRSDPSVVLELDTTKREDYIQRLVADIEQRQRD